MATATQDTSKAPTHNKAPTKFNKARFDDLHNRDDLSDAEEEEYSSLRKLRGESTKARKTTIAALVEQMKSHEITMIDLKDNGAPVPDLDKLYDEDTIKLVAAPHFTKTTGTRGKGKKAEGDGTAKVRNTSKPIKSIAAAGTGAWLAHPPKFLKDEGCLEAYKAGKPVDQWLTNPTDKAAKGNFLWKLAKAMEKKPTKEQLGELTEADVKQK